MANQLHKLKKRQLLELLVAQGKELEAKKAELEAAEKQLANLQKQIAGLEGRLVKLGASVRKGPRGAADQKTEAAMAQMRGAASGPAPESTPAAGQEKPETDGDKQPSGRMDQ